MTKRFSAWNVLCLLAAGLLTLVSGCTTAPGTGRTIFTGGMSESQESQLGFREHPKILKEFGGAYNDPALQAYVTGVGNRLARTSELPDLKFTFTVLDSSIVNAFVLPGGYVYITRGLLAVARDEAEMAGVLAHEIGHVTAKHAAERHGQNLAASLATLGVGLLAGGNAAQAAGSIGQVALRSYSRDQEFESDMLGGRYLARAGYDTKAMAGFLSQLQAHGRLEAEIAGRPGRADEFSILQTHPRTGDRISAALQLSGATPVANPERGREAYLAHLDGMIYGDSPDQGFIRGRRFSHAKLRFTFTVPEGFRLINSADKVAAKGPEGAAILFDRDAQAGPGPMPRYLRDVWAKGVALRGLQAIQVNGLPAATAAASNDTRSGPRDFRLVAIRFDQDTVYRFIFMTPAKLTQGLATALQRTTYSFRRLSAGEAAALRPTRIALYRVQPGDTPAGIAQRMPPGKFRLQRFLVLNGLRENSPLRPGEAVKILRE